MHDLVLTEAYRGLKRSIADLLEPRDLETAIDHGILTNTAMDPRCPGESIRVRDVVDGSQILGRGNVDVFAVHNQIGLHDWRFVVAEALLVNIESKRKETTRRQNQAAADIHDLLVDFLAYASPAHPVVGHFIPVRRILDGILDPITPAQHEAELGIPCPRFVAAAQHHLADQIASPLLPVAF